MPGFRFLFSRASCPQYSPLYGVQHDFVVVAVLLFEFGWLAACHPPPNTHSPLTNALTTSLTVALVSAAAVTK